MDLVRIFTITLIIFVATLNNVTDSAKFLGLGAFPARSHFMMLQSIFKGLAERGHEIDVFSFFPMEKPIPRYNDTSLHGIYPDTTGTFSMDTIFEIFPKNAIKTIINIHERFGVDLCEKLLNSKVLQDLYRSGNNRRYDAILIETFTIDCLLALVHNWTDVPIIGIITGPPYSWTCDRFGLPDNPSFIPNVLLNFSQPMTLPQRIHNTVVHFFMKWSYHYLQTLPIDRIIREKLANQNIPSVYEMEKKFSLLLLNMHSSYFGGRPIPPNVKEVGGIHIQPLKPLPEDIEKILNTSKNGVILFSLGSLTRTETFPREKQRALIEAFAELPFTIIWKTDKTKLEGPFPTNIYFAKWVPQLEILCHSNTKLFITHGGLMGTQEGLYCGVPMIGIPFFVDQFQNVGFLVNMGVAVELKYDDLLKEHILNAIQTVTGNSSFKQKAVYRSTLFRDRPMSPLDTAMFWIEYVVRHGGAYHLRPASVELTWYQYYLLDVFAILFLGLILILSSVYLIVRAIYRKFLRNILIAKMKND